MSIHSLHHSILGVNQIISIKYPTLCTTRTVHSLHTRYLYLGCQSDSHLVFNFPILLLGPRIPCNAVLQNEKLNKSGEQCIRRMTVGNKWKHDFVKWLRGKEL